MKVEIDLDVADDITLQSLMNSYETMTEYLKQYKDPNHGWLAVFSTDKEEDVAALKKMQKALALVINKWYGGQV
jgi:hypothetical protein